MIITVQCPSCSTTFPVDPRKVPEGGVRVRCSACSGIFFVDKPTIPPPAPVVPAGAGSPGMDETASLREGAVTDVADSGESGGDAASEHGTEEDAGGAQEVDVEPVDEPDEPEDVRAGSGDEWAEPQGEPEAEERANVDPWSGAGWDDPADMGAPHREDEADPWTGVASDQVRPEAAGEEEHDELPSPDQASEGWVVERSESVEVAIEEEVHVEPLETVEEATRAAAADLVDEAALDDEGEFAGPPPAAEAPVDPVDASWEPEVEEASPEESGDAVEAPAAEESVGFQFGRRDPHEKARRLARVLVSDIITYNPERHQRALEQGTLHADFEEEIRKSWAEYVEQVGRELAEGTAYWFDALNEILARGDDVF